MAMNILKRIKLKQINRISIDIQSKEKNFKWLIG